MPGNGWPVQLPATASLCVRNACPPRGVSACGSDRPAGYSPPGILRAEIAHLPIVAQEQAHGNFVHKLAFSATGNACDREHKTTLELDQPVQILQSIFLYSSKGSLFFGGTGTSSSLFLEPASKIP